MSDPFVAEIRIFNFNFAPKGWALCDGQTLPLMQNTALFSLLGTTYGGDGRSTFALPNLQGCLPMHPGQGPGLSDYALGETSGSEGVTLLTSEIPGHTHGLVAKEGSLSLQAQGNYLGTMPAKTVLGVVKAESPLYSTATSDQALEVDSIGQAGGSLAHNNLQPYLVVNFCIALQGIFPPRS